MKSLSYYLFYVFFHRNLVKIHDHNQEYYAVRSTYFMIFNSYLDFCHNQYNWNRQSQHFRDCLTKDRAVAEKFYTTINKEEVL